VSGQNVIFVPVVLVLPIVSRGRARLSVIVLLEPYLAVALDLDAQLARQGVDDRDADAVQAAGDLVSLAAELAAGVKNRQNDFDRRVS
jgi:hypothetical protein